MLENKKEISQIVLSEILVRITYRNVSCAS